MARSTILVIDDEPNILTTVRRALEIEGYAVEVAGNGARVAIVGINPFGRIPLDAGLINSRQLRLQGINGSPGVWPRAIRWLSRTGVDLRSLVERQYPLERAVEAVQTQLTTGVRSQLVIE